jgi:hypothetical protein
MRIIDRITLSLMFGFVVAVIPAVPLILLMSLVEDRPPFWLWPFFGIFFSLIAYPATRSSYGNDH